MAWMIRWMVPNQRDGEASTQELPDCLREARAVKRA